MPIYEYRCDSCNHELEALQKLSDAPLTDCPACNQPALVKVVSAPAFRLKGGGWYETDFKTDRDRKRNLAEGSGDKPASSAGASKDAASSAASKAPSSDSAAKTTTPA